MEKYLICLNNEQCKFRTNNTHLPKITGRLKTEVEWHKILCTLYKKDNLGDEYHILFKHINETIILNRIQYIYTFLFNEA